MAHENIDGRRACVKTMIDQGIVISRTIMLEIAHQFDCSHTAIYADIRRLNGQPDSLRAQVCRQVSSQNGRAARLGIVGRIEIDEWIALREQYDNRCLKCHQQKPLVMDHVISLSIGGAHHISNIQPLCRRCNARKFTAIEDYRQNSSQ